ncbi:c-type cytochrome [Ornithinibacillus californiensis]|uniref:c-type cytochrome n=1 Tax=Ornithinibacillus californiensis TaxID=161536 RepID=UPI00064DFCD0|nr:cytochrome c [Ornithinibacillus californiensis]
MKRNPLIPYALIAITGILVVIVIAFVGINQRAELAGDDHGQAEEEIVEDPTAIYEANCLMCHGADLAGGGGPALSAIGAELSLDEIKEIITNGTDNGMPSFNGKLAEQEIAIISEWLSEKK